MEQTPEMQDYLTFMEWFQNKYPDLYIFYWQSITIPGEGEEVTADRDMLDAEAYKAVLKATKEYYQKEYH